MATANFTYERKHPFVTVKFDVDDDGFIKENEYVKFYPTIVRTEEWVRQRRINALRAAPGDVVVEQGMEIMHNGELVKICRYCCEKLDHDYDACPSKDLSPQLPILVTAGAKVKKDLPKPLKIKENAINNSVVIKNLTKDVGEAQLFDTLTHFGPVSKLHLVPVNKTTRLPRGYAIASFENIDDAEKAMNTLNSHGYDIEWLVGAYLPCY
ncbi:hypothetical protein IFM89_036790 [Coptis chinensis]|uniref:RRM domain-containing protein n=1 Tax=Coptis chinensis TaxID=261450 RepID=A0A835LSS0_9MAGN|nr:hypothetical protein IFM89_036790 [Coptis chinensis]